MTRTKTLTSYTSARASTVDFGHQITGALVMNLCNCYTLRIYIHYWIWQIPVLCINIALCLFWYFNESITLELGFFAVAPVFLSALVRDKIFLWLIYWIIKQLQLFDCCTKYTRYHFSRLADCVGGLHSSFGVTTLLWNSIYVFDLFEIEEYELNLITITGLCLPSLLFLICMSAIPCFRFFHHNVFEIFHRYLNWIALCILIFHIYLVNVDTLRETDFYHLTVNTPSLLVIGLVILTFYPWLIIHKINGKNVEIQISENVTSIALIFPIYCPSGAVCKLSTNCVEFHVFGITPLPFDETKGGHRSLVLIKSLGDWTRSVVEKAQNGHLENMNFYMHRIKSPNFSQGLFNWNRVFLLATGSGIAPLLPYIVRSYDLELSLVWVARDHRNNYPKIVFDCLKNLKNMTLYDTTKRKRRDLSLYTVKMVERYDAEAVFIVANPNIAYNVANYVNKKRIPVFASNFDV